MVSRILSLRPLVWIGLISYSLYLWHWPLIVFARHGLLMPFGMEMRAWVTSVAFILAVASWWLIEIPFRKIPKNLPNYRVLVPAAAAMTLLAIAGISFQLAAGFPQRFPADAVQVSNYLNKVPISSFRAGSCFVSSPDERFDWDSCLGAETGKPRVILLGDSHAADLWPGLAPHAHRYNIRQVTATYCPGLVGIYQTGLPFCAEVMDRFYRRYLGISHPQDTVLISQRWKLLYPDALRETIRQLKATGASVVIIGPAPEYRIALPRLEFVALVRKDPGLTGRERDSGVHDTDRLLKDLARTEQAAYVSLIEELCDGTGCKAYAVPGVPMLMDTDHLTPEGAARLTPRILAAIRQNALPSIP
jgi:hypothetical protein